MLYFDIIPEEITSLILLKVENLKSVYDSNVATSILSSANFWALKIHQGMPEIDIIFARKLYICFNENSILISSYPNFLFYIRNWMYSSLKESYNSAMSTIYRPGSILFSFNHIRKFDTFLSLISDDLTKLALKEVNPKNWNECRILLTSDKNRVYKFTLHIDDVKVTSYSISRKQAIYLLMS